MGSNHSQVTDWEDFVHSNKHQKETIRKEIILGIPMAKKSEFFQTITTLGTFQSQVKQQRSNQNVFQTLKQQECTQLTEIQKDIPRTFPKEQKAAKNQKIERLQNVLIAIANIEPEIGHQSGMSFFTWRLLEILDQEDAFWTIYWLFNHHKLLNEIFSNQQCIPFYCKEVDKLIETEAPKLLKVLHHLQIDSAVYCTSWIKSLFALNVQHSKLYTMWEIALLDGEIVWVLIAVAILLCLQTKILRSNRSMEQIVEILNKNPLLDSKQMNASFFDQLERLITKYQAQKIQITEEILKKQ